MDVPKPGMGGILSGQVQCLWDLKEEGFLWLYMKFNQGEWHKCPCTSLCLPQGRPSTGSLSSDLILQTSPDLILQTS